MATRQLYQLRDIRAQDLIGPVVAHKSMQPAIRMFEDVLQSKDTAPGQHPADYDLLFVGTQNDETGEITAGAPQIVATGKGWLEDQQRLATRAGPSALSQQAARPLASDIHYTDLADAAHNAVKSFQGTFDGDDR